LLSLCFIIVVQVIVS